MTDPRKPTSRILRN